MSFDDTQLHHRFKTAANRAADQIALGRDPYDAVAYGGPGKAGAPGYATQVCEVIARDNRLVSFYNQGQGLQTAVRGMVRPWLEGQDVFWVHCFSNTMPNPALYRVYVCAQLASTHTILSALLAGYQNRPLYFKVAAHAEAQVRNDTIVSWHQTLADARAWATIARAHAPLMEGQAPAGTFGGIDVPGVGIDSEVAGETSTGRVADAGLQKAISRSPYI